MRDRKGCLGSEITYRSEGCWQTSENKEEAYRQMSSSRGSLTAYLHPRRRRKASVVGRRGKRVGDMMKWSWR
jgi:hypothetical protein